MAETLYEVDAEGRCTVHLHRGQQRAWRSQARFVFIFAGNQSGKTSFSPIWLDREIRQKGEGDYLAATANYDLFKLKLLPEFRSWFEHTLGVARFWAGERLLELRPNMSPSEPFWAQRADDRMWGRIILRSAEALSGLESATVRGAVLDEVGLPEWTAGAWEAILRRLGREQGRVLGVTTLYNFGWLKTEVYDRWQSGDSLYDIVQFESIDCPGFSREEWERAKATLPRWKFDMLYRGQYTRPAGAVYRDFEDSCIVDRFPVPEAWLWYVGHDFGGSNPAAMLYAIDPATSHIWAVEEYLPGQRSVLEQVQDLKTLTRGRAVVRRVGGSHQEGGWRDAFTQQGWPIIEPRANVQRVDTQIGAVQALHKLNKVFAFRDLRAYLEEKGSFSYKLDSFHQPTDELDHEERYHLMAAERYILSDFVPERVEGWGRGQPRRELVYAQI